MVAWDPYSDHGIFPRSRKRRTLGTIPVTLNMKKGTMKVTREEALEISRQTLKRAEQERQEERMELKPIDKMDDSDCKKECFDRMGLEYGNIWPKVLNILRENDIGTENLAPPEPDWKRWRKWPEEKPMPFTHVEWELKSPQCAETGIYIPFESVILPFRKGLGRGVGSGVRCWRYLNEPLAWKVVKRDGNPSEVGWYEIPLSGPYRQFRYWEGKFWNLHMGGPICGDPSAYCPIAPAPKFEGADDAK